jgi:hypothetical protein
MSDLTFRVIAPQRGTPGWFRRWLLAPPPGPTIGRKRRARRARGRRIEGRRMRELRQPRLSLNGAWVPVGFCEGVTVSPGSITIRWRPTAAAAAFLDPSLGEPWEGTHEADQDPR